MKNFNVSFICTANASRSPMAEQLFKLYMNEHGISGIDVCSAGVTEHARHGVADIVEAAMLRKKGVDIAGRKRVHISEIDTDSVDLFVVMEEFHRDELEYLGVEKRRIYKLAGGVPDPFRRTLKEHRRCMNTIEASLDELMDIISDKL